MWFICKTPSRVLNMFKMLREKTENITTFVCIKLCQKGHLIRKKKCIVLTIGWSVLLWTPGQNLINNLFFWENL